MTSGDLFWVSRRLLLWSKGCKADFRVVKKPPTYVGGVSLRIVLAVVFLMALSVPGWTAKWTTINPYGITYMTSLAVAPSNPLVVYAISNMSVPSKIYASSDGGQTWNTGVAFAYTSSDYDVQICVHPTDANIVFILTAGNLRRSLDGGATWTTVGQTFPLTVPAMCMCIWNNRIVIGGYDGVAYKGAYYMTLADAVSPGAATAAWTSMNSSQNMLQFWKFAANSGSLFAWEINMGLCKYDQNSSRWTKMNASYNPNVLLQWCVAIAIDPVVSNNLVYFNEDIYSNRYFYRTTDSGATNISITSLTNSMVWTIVYNPLNTTILYAGGDMGVFFSSDSGSSWVAMNDGFATTPVIFGLATAVSGNVVRIYAIGNMGLAFTDIVTARVTYDTVSVKAYNTVFDPTKPVGEGGGLTKILYDLNSPNSTIHVNVKVYTLSGKLVKTLDDATYSPGTYNKDWNGRNESGDIVASGIYLVYVKAGDASKWIKVAVVK